MSHQIVECPGCLTKLRVKVLEDPDDLMFDARKRAFQTIAKVGTANVGARNELIEVFKKVGTRKSIETLEKL